MKAVILAAGIASRLRPLTESTPKCLLTVGDKTILALALNNLLANKITDIIIVTGYLEEQIRDFVTVEYPGLHVDFINNEWYATTNNIFSLWLTKKSIADDDVLLMDSDIIFDESIITQLLHSPFDNCLALKRHAVGEEEIKVKADDRNRVIEISKEVIPDEAIGESIGIEKFSARTMSRLFDIMDRKVNLEKNVNQFYEAAFQELITTGDDIFVVDITDHMCMEIDTVQDLFHATDLMGNFNKTN